jgi:hypothetical protein
MAFGHADTNMLVMQPPTPNKTSQASRRFVLLPEEPANGQGQAERLRIRRYQLTSVGRRFSGCRERATNPSRFVASASTLEA